MYNHLVPRAPEKKTGIFYRKAIQQRCPTPALCTEKIQPSRGKDMEGKNDMGMSKLLKQAQKMQEKMQRELSETVTEATIGGGAVHAKMNGHRQLLTIKISPEAIDREDVAGLQDLVLTAVNKVTQQMDEILRRKLGPTATSMPSLF